MLPFGIHQTSSAGLQRVPSPVQIPPMSQMPPEHRKQLFIQCTKYEEPTMLLNKYRTIKARKG